MKHVHFHKHIYCLKFCYEVPMYTDVKVVPISSKGVECENGCVSPMLTSDEESEVVALVGR